MRKLGLLLSVLALCGWNLACGGDDSTTDTGTDTGDADTAEGETGDDGEATDTPDSPPVDADGDTYPEGEDCDDTDADVFPGANEYCNGVDDNCDGETDEDSALDASTWYADTDGDEFGDPDSTRTACTQPTGFVDNDEDCDDGDGEINPDTEEICNGADDDCDGETDEEGATGATAYYPDGDLDGYGGDAGEVLACSMPTGYTPFGGDCDDTAEAVNPGSPELCNGVDDNCDGTTDEDTAIDAVNFYRDADGDTFGDRADTVVACAPPAGYVADDTDCADGDAAIHPGAADGPDLLAVDSNCDGVDGDLTMAVFVSVSTGDDTATGLGTRGTDGSLVVDPVATLARAIEIADACDPKCYVLVAEGTYNQGTTSLELREGVSLYAGYDTSWVRDRPIAATVLTSTASPAVRANAITLDTVLELLTVQGPTMTAAGQESVALLVLATPATGRLTLRAMEINAGQGGPGAAGAAGTTTSCSCAGGAGGTSYGCGANAGASGSCGGAAGGAGGTSWCADTCFYWGDPIAGDGAVGTAGSDGSMPTTAAARSTNVLGSFDAAGNWLPTSGGNGAAGGNGGGGGGGGGGGWWRHYCALDFCVYDFGGGTGGHGGHGGCAGTAGGGGGQGGGSFGLVLVNSLVTIDTVGIRMGVAGNGGAGGSGGGGGVRTTGLAGGNVSPSTCGVLTARPGDGGAGGNGGHGGGGSGGAGGNGGPSIGVALVGITSRVDGDAPDPDPTSASAGALGGGGTGGLRGSTTTRSPNGADGLAGVMAQVQTY